MKVNVLITGVGGNLGQFIFKALQHSNYEYKVVGCDYSCNALGLFQTDIGYVVPPANSANYIEKIMEICLNEEIHIIMAGGMVELRLLSKNRELIKEKTNAFVVSSDIDKLRIMEDKWNLVQFLEESGFDYPHSILSSQTDQIKNFVATYNFPLVVKDRLGSGSKGLGIAKNNEELDLLIKNIPNAVIQEYLYPDDEEYTVGVFVGSNGKASGSIVMKRDLDLGMTFKAEVFPESIIGEYCENVLEKIGCIGPANVQLRLTKRGPVIFEINPRFSSTTSARPLFGYNDVAMSINDFVFKNTNVRPNIKKGRLFRYIDDVFVSMEDYNTVETNKKIINEGMAVFNVEKI